MKNLNINVKYLNISALAIGLAFSVGAMAGNMSKEQYKFLENNLGAEYTAAKAGCNSLAGNANDICAAQATGRMNVAKAELEASYKPSVKTRYDARAASADADYSVAMEKCDNAAGNAKEVCVTKAKTAKNDEIAAAIVQIRTSKPDAMANEKPADAETTR